MLTGDPNAGLPNYKAFRIKTKFPYFPVIGGELPVVHSGWHSGNRKKNKIRNSVQDGLESPVRITV